MKKILFFAMSLILYASANAQVTQINSNKSLEPVVQLNNTEALFESGVDSSVWVSDGTLAGTFSITDTIKYVGAGSLLNGKFIFKGMSPHCGAEIFISDGTKAGTKLIKDINPGTANSQPATTIMTLMNGYVYFAAVTASEGCELWRTDGTEGNTKIVKDIVLGTGSGIDSNYFSMAQLNNTLLFSAQTAATGNELFSTDGTVTNTGLLIDIVANASSSNPRGFYYYNNMYLFTVNSSDGLAAELWRTDGTKLGTKLLKNNIGTGIAGINYYSNVFHIFNNLAYFLIDDNIHPGDALYSTNGVDNNITNTVFIKDLGVKTMISSFLLADAINISGTFIFPFTDLATTNALWQSDGTSGGTKVFESFPANLNNNIPIIYTNLNFNPVTKTITYPLYNGNFFFSANSTADGNELWKSDGTVANTQIVKDINPGTPDGINENLSWIYTSSGLYFAADDGVDGNELWKTDGASQTSMVKDIFPGAHNANPSLVFINNNKLFFTATDNNPADSSVTDLYVVDGVFSPLPVSLLDFTVSPKGADALLHWSTSQEINSRDFTVRSSDDAQHWNDIGTVPAAGNSYTQSNYSFTDVGVMNSGKDIVYYRLAETDIDGKITNSNIIYIKINNINQWNAQLYSNPVHDNVRLMLTGIQDNAIISINDINGQVVYKKQIQNQNGLMTLPVNLERGVYLLVVTTNNEMKTIKFVKE
ncbi:MAG TPA: T9SS type A sorting domain-containing protein [Hanamia sp.]|nr:T9SS type A sorting domain-containing protein [Hanamia sp.]